MNLFTRHPSSVGEGYGEHLLVAMSFGMTMLIGGLGCMIHAVLPFLFEKTASRTVVGLHARMVEHRRRCSATHAFGAFDWAI